MTDFRSFSRFTSIHCLSMLTIYDNRNWVGASMDVASKWSREACRFPRGQKLLKVRRWSRHFLSVVRPRKLSVSSKSLRHLCCSWHHPVSLERQLTLVPDPLVAKKVLTFLIHVKPRSVERLIPAWLCRLLLSHKTLACFGRLLRNGKICCSYLVEF